MSAIVVTPEDVVQLRKAGPGSWLVRAAGVVAVLGTDPIGTGALEIATYSTLQGLAEACQDRGVEPTDEQLAHDLTDIATDYAADQMLLLRYAGLLEPLVELLHEYGIVREGPPLTFHSDVAPILAQRWLAPNGVRASVGVTLVLGGTVTIEIAGRREDLELVLSAHTPYEAVAAGLASMAGCPLL